MKYYHTHDNSNVHYTHEYSLAHNCKQNIKLLHCTVNNLKIHARQKLRCSDFKGGGGGGDSCKI